MGSKNILKWFLDLPENIFMIGIIDEKGLQDVGYMSGKDERPKRKVLGDYLRAMRRYWRGEQNVRERRETQNKLSLSG